LSLGGVWVGAEIGGHGGTYIGSLPGLIFLMLGRAGPWIPLFFLDGMDKVGDDYRGDPSSALFEALVPEQNPPFYDHYLVVDYDLSDVMFVTPAHPFYILPPLLDRMGVISIPGYTVAGSIYFAH
jgi:ATP-dependent Lon protease, bacterial type